MNVLSVVFILVATWAALAASLWLYRHFLLISFRRALLNGDDRVAVSLGWAWATQEQILAAQQYWGSDIFGDILDFRRPEITRLFLFPRILFVMPIVLYQIGSRFAGHGLTGPCPSTPNCSNYLIGCLTRTGIITSLARAHIRISNCAGEDDVNYHPDFQ